ncbi:type I restriction endonuclease subunit R [Gallibacterium anatis]|uniref:Type I restriction enzyme endonuclease subunit n=1 Tax=Gallibacterium anatis TaxID=750 RepID=A0A1A7NRN1_9PAST|nr:HsdR family type I site-specific deoxyribonuclease [Gallibacterium anatis]OBW92265.1 restriction endonuclease subunit R [Gallibacterium anatis]OBW98897.1 restriction endonuclease subunit R [Gallibacterium anatis]
MSNIISGQKERATQNRVVQLFQQSLGYRYLGDLQGLDNKNIREDDLIAWLKQRGVADKLILDCVMQLQKENYVGNGRRLYDANQAIYRLLRYGVKVKTSVGENTQTVWLIDWDNPENNDFAIAEEVSIQGVKFDKRPDLVLYVNGLALGVIELKRSSVSVSEGIRQNLLNQNKDFAEHFFTTVQLVMAGNDTQGLRYGVIETSEKYYLQWKEEGKPEGDLDADLIALCSKARLLELIHDFMVFDAGVKKTCRHNQFFGVKAAQQKIKQNEGGIIWHTQGSGKSLTMVWLTQWILEQGNNNRVLIITDRTELDEQIHKVFTHTNHTIYRTKSGRDLWSVLDKNAPALICSLVHKFGRKGVEDEPEDAEFAEYLDDIRLQAGAFSPKGNLVVFVDECHRTQSGKLHEAMRALLPDAIFIGFTGTPLLKADKKKSVEVFGGYIHTYKFNEAVADGVVLDLLYEARDIEQSLSSPGKVDQWFELKTKGLTDIAKTQLKQRWGTMQKLLSSKSRLEKIVDDILVDMETKPRLSNGHGNAILVCSSVYQACQTYELISQTTLKDKVAIITSFKPNASAIKNGLTGNGQSEEQYKYDTYRKMLANYFRQSENEMGEQQAEQFEIEVKKRFIEQPAQMKLLIVVDKLLTGFDAPSATYLYIDKPMADHNLFQAICRVNRLDGESKTYGYIVDYRDLFKSLQKAFNDFTQEAFGNYEQEDIEGLLKDRLEEAKKDLETAWEAIEMIVADIPAPKDLTAYKRFFCGQDSFENIQTEFQTRRLSFYQAVVKLIRSYTAIANEMTQAGYSEMEAKTWLERVKEFTHLRDEIKMASGDYVDLKAYDADMRYLINQYVNAEESKILTSFENMGLLELLVNTQDIHRLPEEIKNNPNMAETIENNVRRKIVDENPVNPKYYERMSVLLNELIEQRKQATLDYQTYLEKITELTQKVMHPQDRLYPESINTEGKQALYDNLVQDDAWVNQLHRTIQENKQDGYVNNKMKQKRLKQCLQPLFEEKNVDSDQGLDLIMKQEEYRA